jgi:hypothetical protein
MKTPPPRKDLPLASYLGTVSDDARVFFKRRLTRTIITKGPPSPCMDAIVCGLAGWMRQGVFALRSDILPLNSKEAAHALTELCRLNLAWDCDRGITLTVEGQLYAESIGVSVDYEPPAPTNGKQLCLFAFDEVAQ